jgi:hypothetical protein
MDCFLLCRLILEMYYMICMSLEVLRATIIEIDGQLH